MSGNADLRTAWSSRTFAGESVIDGRADPMSSWHEALGRTLAGGRAALVLDGTGLDAVAGALGGDLASRAPIVVRVHCADGHDALHAASRAGAVVLVARSAQEACDLDLVARRVAERALVPVVVGCDLDPGAPEAVVLPSDAMRARCVGEPADRIAAVGPAQRTAFGATRRRLPRWVDLDARVSVGAARSRGLAHRAGIAGALFGRDGLEGIVSEALAAVAAATGRELTPVRATGVGEGDGVIVTTGAVGHAASGHGWGLVSLLVLSPLPETALRSALGRARRVVVLERCRRVTEAPPGLAARVESVLCRRPGSGNRHAGLFRRRDADTPILRTGIVGPAPDEPRPADVRAFLDAVRSGETGEAPVFVGVSFRPEAGAPPKRQAMLDAILRGHPGIDARAVQAEAATREPIVVPASGHRWRGSNADSSSDSGYTSGAAHFDRVGILDAVGRAAEVLPDPLLALPTVPAGTAALRPTNPTALPSLDAERCHGCGACWSLCPEGAIRPASHTARGFVDFALDAGRRAGGRTEALRPLAGRLAARFRPAGDLAAAIRASGEEVYARGDFDAERGGSIAAAVEVAADATAGVVLAAALPASFGDECLALGLDPEACSACGICAAVCEPGAFQDARTVDAAGLESARRSWSRFLELPETPASSLDRLAGVLGEAARLGFRETTLEPLVPGDRSQEAAGSRLALRLALGAVEAAEAPRVAARLEQVEELRARVGERIREALADALPDADLVALSAGLEGLGDGDVPLAKLAERLGDACEQGIVHAGTVGHLAGLGRELADLATRLRGGREGRGRARGAVLVVPDPSLDWAVAEPWNPLTWPSVRGPVGLAGGLLDGLTVASAEDAALVARAEATLRGPKRIHATVRSARNVASSDLQEPSPRPAPLVVVGTAERLCGVDVGTSLRLLRGPAPVVVLALAADLGSPIPDWVGAACPSVVFHAVRDLARADGLVGAVRRGLAAGRSVFVHAVAPNPLVLEPPAAAGDEPVASEGAEAPVEVGQVPPAATSAPAPSFEDAAAVLRDRLTDLALQGIARARENP